ncbi:MAG: SMC-Scp complex subunit ScpB [Bdellovibrionota bacterium]
MRGVDAGSIIKNLLERDLIKCVGRKEDAGRPMLFGTTSEFLQVYQLDTIKDLPPLDSFQPALDTIENANELIDGDREVDIAPFIDDSDILDEEDNLLITSEDNELQEDLVADEEKEDIEDPAEQNIANNESEEITSSQNITGAIFAESIDLNQQENEINITASEEDESFFTAPNDSGPAKTHFE